MAVESASAGDASNVHRLVSDLEHDDPAVRMYAINALKRLCGEDFGYEFYAPLPERLAAVERWQDALQRGEVRVAAHAAAAEMGG